MSAALRIYDEIPGTERRARVTLRLASERITAREVIRQRVEAEVAAFNATKDDVFRGLIQPSESERLLNGFKLRKRRPLDVEQQVAVALEAFEKNGFLLLLDDRQVEDLDEVVTVTPESSATFLRLVPLVGG